MLGGGQAAWGGQAVWGEYAALGGRGLVGMLIWRASLAVAVVML